MMQLRPISKSEAARYMGISGEPSDVMQDILDRCELLVRNTVKPKYVYRRTSVSITEEGVKLGCIDVPLSGEDIKKHLKGCNEAILLAATLSGEADKLIRQAAVSDMAEALAVDCLCSAAVEQVCEQAEEEIFSSADAPYRTWRFSPGYGDLPLSLQKEFLYALNAQRRIGLTVTESSLLIPTKSVTALIGISQKPVEQSGHGCEVCSMRDRCAFAASGRKCRSL